MKFKAVIFDLFGTLVDNFSKKEHDKVYALMAETLSAPYEAFRQAFGSSYSGPMYWEIQVNRRDYRCMLRSNWSIS
ncbi:MAG: hypothetical protein F4Y79_12595 [Gemmatimonadetes bacterium]|nr:hypothetical protein [Gemmatimonadota bacterium]